MWRVMMMSSDRLELCGIVMGVLGMVAAGAGMWLLAPWLPLVVLGTVWVVVGVILVVRANRGVDDAA